MIGRDHVDRYRVTDQDSVRGCDANVNLGDARESGGPKTHAGERRHEQRPAIDAANDGRTHGSRRISRWYQTPVNDYESF